MPFARGRGRWDTFFLDKTTILGRSRGEEALFSREEPLYEREEPPQFRKVPSHFVPRPWEFRKEPSCSGKVPLDVAPDRSPDEISTCAHIRTRIYRVVLPTFYVSHLSHLSLVGTILLGQMGQVGHLFLA